MLLKVKTRTRRAQTYLDVWHIGGQHSRAHACQSVDGKKCRVWLGLKLLRNYASHVSTIASVHSEKNKSVEENKEKGKKRSTVAKTTLEAMFGK